MGVPRAAQRQAVKGAALVDALTGQFAAEMGEALTLLRARIRALLRQFDREQGQIVKTAANLARALAMERQIAAALEEAGWQDLALAATDEPLNAVARQALATRAGTAAARLSAFDAEALAALKTLRFAEILEVGDDLAASLWRAVLDGVLGAQSRETLVEDLSDLMDDTAATAKTLYDTAVSTYMRQAQLLHTTGDPGERFIYLGPDDNVTRPFCRTHLNETLTRREIEGLDNGQLPNPLITGGGFNCRHQFVPIGLEPVEAEAAA